MRLPQWPPRDWRALIALIASIGGAMALTGFSLWVVWTLGQLAIAYPETRLEVVKALANSNYGLLGIIGAILLSLGLAINRRSIKASAFGASFDASGGDPDAPAAAQAVADTAQVKADEIKGDAQ